MLKISLDLIIKNTVVPAKRLLKNVGGLGNNLEAFRTVLKEIFPKSATGDHIIHKYVRLQECGRVI